MMAFPLMSIVFALSVTSSVAADPLRIGVRSDAAPFVYSDAQAKFGFDGFLFKICKAAASDAGFTIEPVLLEAAERESAIRTGGSIDMLCDPFTVKRERARKFRLSQIVFAFGGSFLFSRNKSNQALQNARALVRERLAAGLEVRDHAGRLVTNQPGAERQPVIAEVSPGDFQRKAIDCDSASDAQIASVRVGVVKGSTAPRVLNNILGVGASTGQTLGLPK